MVVFIVTGRLEGGEGEVIKKSLILQPGKIYNCFSKVLFQQSIQLYTLIQVHMFC